MRDVRRSRWVDIEWSCMKNMDNKRRFAAGRPLVGMDLFFVQHDDPVVQGPRTQHGLTAWRTTIRSFSGPIYLDLNWITLARRLARRLHGRLTGPVVITVGSRDYSRQREPLSIRFVMRDGVERLRVQAPDRVVVSFEFEGL